MDNTLEGCARALLEVVPLIMQNLRQTMRSHSLPDLRFPELRSMAFLRHNPGSNLTDLAEFIGVSLPSMSKLVDSLTFRGLIDRQPDTTDRRRVRLSLTAAGTEALTSALTAVQTSFMAKLAPLEPQDLTLIHNGLQLLQPIFATGAGSASVRSPEDQPAVS